MPEAARLADPTSHGTPLSPGPGSPDVDIGFLPAWRALPAGVGAAVETLSNTMNGFMTTPSLTPTDAQPDLADINSGLVDAALQAAVAGNPAAVGAATGALISLTATNVTLTTTWTAASPAPGGQPAANVAYTEGIKAAAAAAAVSVMSAIGAMSDMHVCPVPTPIPPHGPGMVTKASTTVEINGLPACRKDDKVFEACGGSDPIVMGCPTVEIGDETGSGGGGASAPPPGPAADSPQELVPDENPGVDDAAASATEEAFTCAAYYGTPLVERCPRCNEV